MFNYSLLFTAEMIYWLSLPHIWLKPLSLSKGICAYKPVMCMHMLVHVLVPAYICMFMRVHALIFMCASCMYAGVCMLCVLGSLR